jgi:hypothetical protein
MNIEKVECGKKESFLLAHGAIDRAGKRAIGRGSGPGYGGELATGKCGMILPQKCSKGIVLDWALV